MKILAVDTATEACSAAVLWAEDSDGAGSDQAPGSARTVRARASTHIVSRYEEPGRGHAERILTLVDAVLGDSQLTLGRLDAIAFGRGPGGFTGVRLAASVAQGLAFGAGLPVVPISNLRAIAQRVLDAAPAAQSVLVCADARMREVYWGCFRRGASGLAEAHAGTADEGEAQGVAAGARQDVRPVGPAGAERVSAPDKVELPLDLEVPIHGGGRGFQAYAQLEAKLGARLATVHHDLLPRAAEIARLAALDLAAGLAVEPQRAVPLYLRDDVARPPS